MNTVSYLVPSLPPQKVSAQNTSSSSVLVTWEPVPRGHIHGILGGYRVLNKRAGSEGENTSIATRNSSTYKVDLPGLEKFTTYNITVLAFTRVGDGAFSQSILVSTDEDGM